MSKQKEAKALSLSKAFVMGDADIYEDPPAEEGITVYCVQEIFD